MTKPQFLVALLIVGVTSQPPMYAEIDSDAADILQKLMLLPYDYDDSTSASAYNFMLRTIQSQALHLLSNPEQYQSEVSSALYAITMDIPPSLGGEFASLLTFVLSEVNLQNCMLTQAVMEQENLLLEILTVGMVFGIPQTKSTLQIVEDGLQIFTLMETLNVPQQMNNDTYVEKALTFVPYLTNDTVVAEIVSDRGVGGRSACCIKNQPFGQMISWLVATNAENAPCLMDYISIIRSVAVGIVEL